MHAGLDRREEVLLLPDDRPRPHDAQPAHGLPRREAAPPHQVERGERAGAAEARGAVHGDRARGRIGEGEEADEGGGRRRIAVGEGEAVVGDAGGGEGGWVVSRALELDDGGSAELVQDGDEVCRGKVAHGAAIAVDGAGEVARPAEGDELARDHLVQVAVERVVVMRVLGGVDAPPAVGGVRAGTGGRASDATWLGGCHPSSRGR